MQKYILTILSLLVLLAVVGCNRYVIPEKILMASPDSGFIPEVEITDAYCTENTSGILDIIDLKFTLNNLKNESMDVQYYWSLNDPQADGPGYNQNVNDPAARIYQGQAKVTLPASDTTSPTWVTVNVNQVRDYDPRFYRMYISVYHNNTRVGFYSGQKATYDWDYNVVPPVPKLTTAPGNMQPSSGNPVTTATEAPPKDPTQAVASVYAKHYGITMDEALNRLKLQEDFSNLNLGSQLETNEAETFGGLWIQHEPEYKLVIAFTRDGETTMQRYQSSIPNEVAPYIEIKTVKYSQAKLKLDQEQTTAALLLLGIRFSASTYIMDNEVRIGVYKESQALFEQAIQDGQVTIPETVKVYFTDAIILLN